MKWPCLVPADLGNDSRTTAAIALQSPYYDGITDSAVPELVLAQVKALVDIKIASLRALEAKAAQIAGFAGTVVAVMGAFSHTLNGNFGKLGLVFLIITIASCLCAMSIRSDELPSPALYNSNLVARDPSNKARIAMALAEAYTEYSADLQHQSGRKARFAYAGFASFFVALFFLAISINALALSPTKNAARAVVSKSVSKSIGHAGRSTSACRASHDPKSRNSHGAIPAASGCARP